MYEQRLPIEEWKAKKQAELKETIAAQRSALQEVVQDGQRLAGVEPLNHADHAARILHNGVDAREVPHPHHVGIGQRILLLPHNGRQPPPHHLKSHAGQLPVAHVAHGNHHALA